MSEESRKALPAMLISHCVHETKTIDERTVRSCVRVFVRACVAGGKTIDERTERSCAQRFVLHVRVCGGMRAAACVQEFACSTVCPGVCVECACVHSPSSAELHACNGMCTPACVPTRAVGRACVWNHF